MTNRGAPAPVRAVGWISLTAISINGMVGGGIFGLPSTIAALLGAASPLAYVAAGVAVLLIALCFAEAGSLYDRTGGPYVYAHEAFGPLVAFEVGWMFILGRVVAVAAVTNTFAAYLGYLWPAAAQGAGRVITVTLVTALITWVNCRGVRPGVWLINCLTIGKMLPLFIFCAIGLFFIDPHRISFITAPDTGSLRAATLLLIFAIGGFEFASVPSEEVIQSRRVLPLVTIASVTLVVVLYLVIQVVALGTLPELSTSAAPLTSAARTFLGPAGALLVTLGAIFSTTGTSSGSTLVASRMLYALGQGGLLPPAIARLHPRFRTPITAILLFAAVAWTFAVLGTFAQLAAMAALARLFYYTTTCAAIPMLRRKTVPAGHSFTLPGGAVIPVIATVVCLWLFTGSTRPQAIGGAAALLFGALLFLIFRHKSRAA